MPSVAEVQFKASGQQQVVGAFKSVGDSAATATTKVQQNSGAMKTMGQGMKNSIGGIAQVGTAFATLSLSIVGTWRAYRDLGDAQNQVDKANKKVTTATIALKKAQDDVNKLTTEGSKGSLESTAATNKIRLAEQKLAVDRKSGKKTALELQVAQDAINLAKKEGTGKSAALAAAEEKLGVAQETLRINTNLAGEAQERFNDTQQDFYLSLLPTALSGIASLSLAFGGLKGVLGGGAGGIVGMLGPIGIGLGAISLAVIAFQTNFLGLRDKIGGVITWFKERFGAWKDTLEEVFGFIQKGDWAGAFNRIKEAAASFWADLKKSVPFFGQVESIVNKIKNGNWKGAFLEIAVAAKAAWETLKKAVPFFAGAEIFIKQLLAGNWAGAWATIAKGAQDALAGIFGGDANGKTGIATKLIAEITQIPIKLKAAMSLPGATAWSVIDAILPTPVKQFAATVNAWTKEFGTLVLNALKSGITFVAHTWIDPFLASLFDIATWQAALTAITPATLGIMKMILDVMFPIPGGKADPNSAKYLEIATGIFKSIGTSVHTASAIYLPEYTQANDNLVNNLKTAILNGAAGWKDLGITIWNSVIEGLKQMLPFASVGLDALKIKPQLDTSAIDAWTKNANIKVPTTPQVVSNAPDIINKAVNPGRGQYKVPVLPDTSKMPGELASQLTKVLPKNTKLAIGGNATGAQQAANKAVQNINKMHATIQVSASYSGQARAALGARGGIVHAAGFKGTIKRPTVFTAGEGGRPEDVYIKPKGSAGLGPSGGGDVYVGPIYLDGEEIYGRMRYKINKNQGVMK